MELYDQARFGLLELGVQLPQEPQILGGGAYATAYATECGRVVKITGDREERLAALLARESPQPHLVHVEHVFSLGAMTVIVVERLTRLPQNIKAHWWTPWELGASEETPKERAHRAWGQRFEGPPPPEILLVAQAHAAIARSIRAAGILYCNDAHAANVMVRPSTGEIVLSDLGLTRTSKKLEAPLLPRPGIEGGDDGDCHRDPVPPRPAPPELVRAPDPRKVQWERDAVLWPLRHRDAQVGDVLRVRAVDRERGVVNLERLPQVKPANEPPRPDPFWGVERGAMSRAALEQMPMPPARNNPGAFQRPPARDEPPAGMPPSQWERAKREGCCPCGAGPGGCPVDYQLQRMGLYKDQGWRGKGLVPAEEYRLKDLVDQIARAREEELFGPRRGKPWAEGIEWIKKAK